MLRSRQIIPPLTARTPAGQLIRAWDFKQKKNLVIAFLHADCARCAAWLERLAAHAGDLAEREAAALVIFSEVPPAIRTEALPAEIFVAVDQTGRSQRAYLGEAAFGASAQERLGVFVADRYGELYAQWLSGPEHALGGVGEALEWLAQIQVACEECGVSHWPAED